jgi:RNA ligase
MEKVITEINSMEALQELVRAGETHWKQYGEVRAQEHDGLILFNYTPLAQAEGRWNYFERISRGLILDRETGEVIARPFDKFFNWGEAYSSDMDIADVQEKMDGSLGILYRWKGQEHVATRGSMLSEQASWATIWWREHIRDRTKELKARGIDLGDEKEAFFSSDCTILFEIIYPENRIVIDYDKEAKLVVLAIRHRITGKYISREDLEFWANFAKVEMAPYYEIKSIDDVLQALDSMKNKEGFVVTMRDGTRWKFKTEEYRYLHKLISGCSFQHVLRTLQEQGDEGVQTIMESIPSKYANQVAEWVNQIERRVSRFTRDIYAEFGSIDAMSMPRKEFADYVNNHLPKEWRSYAFMVFDHKELRPAMLKREFQNRNDRLI